MASAGSDPQRVPQVRTNITKVSARPHATHLTQQTAEKRDKAVEKSMYTLETQTHVLC